MNVALKMRTLGLAAIFAVAAIFVGAFASGVGAQSNTLDAAKRAEMESAVRSFMEKTHAPGISVAAVVNGELVWSEGFGFADLEAKVAATPETLYRLASVSKPLTATGAMELWERGKLDLDAPIQEYCPQFPVKPYPITTRELLGHLGGIRHYKSGAEDLEGNNTKHFDDPIAGGIQFFANDALVEIPGAKFHYSTQGYTLVGCAIERASGEKYADFVTKNVFVPAGMTHTFVDDRYKIIANRTRFYSGDQSGAVLNADPLDSSYKIPGGGWLSTAPDMAEFEIAMLDDKLVKRATRNLMWTAQKQKDGTMDHYGLGFGILKVGELAAVGHAGAQQGTSTDILMVPEKRDGIVVLINMDGVDASGLGHGLMEIALREK
jgi:CubicO group peptidase (beta-lactamase class C family)